MYASEGCAVSHPKCVVRRPASGHFLSAASVIISDSTVPALPGIRSGAPSLSALLASYCLTLFKPYIDLNTLDAVRIGPEPRLRCSTSRTRSDFGPRLGQHHGP